MFKMGALITEICLVDFLENGRILKPKPHIIADRKDTDFALNFSLCVRARKELIEAATYIHVYIIAS